MEIRAISKSVRMSPRKTRLVADSISKMSISQALIQLQTTPKRAGVPLFKTLKSAIANAKQNNELSQEQLMIQRILVTEGPSLKRFHPSTRGRIHPYKKRSSHITIVLSQKGDKHGTKS